MHHSVARKPFFFAKSADGCLDRLGVLRAAVDRQRRAVARHGGELVVVDVDGNDLGAERVGDLDAVAAYAARANDDGDASELDSRASDRLVGGGKRVGDDRNIGERESCAGQTRFVHLAQATAGDHDVRGEAALDVVARHFLLAADCAEPALAKVALATRQHGGHDCGLAFPALGTRTCVDHTAADFVSQRQRQGVVGPNAVVEITEVGVTDAATGDVDDDFAGARLRAKRRALQRRIYRGHQPAIRFEAHRCTSSMSSLCCSMFRFAPLRRSSEGLDRAASGRLLSYYSTVIPIYVNYDAARGLQAP